MATTPEIPSRGSVPTPDPTVLTTEQLERAISGLRDLLRTEMAGHRQVLETRLDDMDKAKDLLRVAIGKIPEEVDKNVVNLRTLHDEKFRSIQTQFAERDVRTEQSAKDSKVAVDAALQAAKEAVGEQNKSSSLAIAKSETATTKQIDQLGVLITATTKTTDDKIDDLKGRLTTIESRNNGMTEQKTDTKGQMSLIISAITVAILFVTLILPLLTSHAPNAGSPQVVYVPAPAGAMIPSTPK